MLGKSPINKVYHLHLVFWMWLVEGSDGLCTFFIELDRVGSLPGPVQSLTTDSCFVDLPDVTLVYSKIVEVFVDVIFTFFIFPYQLFIQ